MGAWKRARHDGARNILVRLGKAAGLREGVDMDVEVPYLFTRYRPSDIRVRIRPGGQDMHFAVVFFGLSLIRTRVRRYVDTYVPHVHVLGCVRTYRELGTYAHVYARRSQTSPGRGYGLQKRWLAFCAILASPPPALG